jgi:hypothetical protein
MHARNTHMVGVRGVGEAMHCEGVRVPFKL